MEENGSLSEHSRDEDRTHHVSDHPIAQPHRLARKLDHKGSRTRRTAGHDLGKHETDREQRQRHHKTRERARRADVEQYGSLDGRPLQLDERP